MTTDPRLAELTEALQALAEEGRLNHWPDDLAPEILARWPARTATTEAEALAADEDDAVWRALLYVLAWSDDEARNLRAAASMTFIRALEQTGYTVVPIAAALAATGGSDDR